MWNLDNAAMERLLAMEEAGVRFVVDNEDFSILNDVQVIPTPSHLLDRISPISSPFFPVFCAFSPPGRGGSNEPQAGIQGQETAARGPRAENSALHSQMLTKGSTGSSMRIGSRRLAPTDRAALATTAR